MVHRVGIISANWGAFAHLPGWRAIPGVEVVGICTSRRETAEAAAARHGIPRAFWDAEAMAADPDIDILDCGTRPDIRAPMVLAALRHSKHVYNAIPFAADLETARAIHDAWRAGGRVGVVDAYSEWLPALRGAKAMIEDGRLGRPFAGTCIFNMALFNRQDPRFPYTWFGRAGTGVSAVRNLGSHALHMLIHLFGPIDAVVAHETQLLPEYAFTDGSTMPAETNDFANALLRFANGMTVQFQICWNAPLGRGFHLEAYGGAGRFTIDAPSFPTVNDTVLHAGTLDAATMVRVEPTAADRADPGLGIDANHPVAPAFPMALSMRAMIRAIEGGAPAHPDFGQAWEVERVQEAIRRSSEGRRWVALAEIA